MKKTFYIIIAAMMILSGCGEKPTDESQLPESDNSTEISVPEETEEETTERPTERVREIETAENFEYEVLDGEVTITKYTGTDIDVIIPDTIEGAPVTKVGFLSFEAKWNVETITLPETITLICEGAFMDCSSLRSINIPETVTGIERSAFAACTSLESLTIPEATEFIEMEAFTACESLTSLTVLNSALEYQDWGLEALPALTLYAPADSAVCKWAEENGINVSIL